MGKKKKKKGRSRASADYEEATDEMLALQSIYDSSFTPAEDGLGFTIAIVPHPGEAASNSCSIDLEIK